MTSDSDSKPSASSQAAQPTHPDLTFALTLADTADKIALSHYNSTSLHVESKPDDTPVTQADREIEQTLREKIAAEFPEDSIIGEEFSEEMTREQIREQLQTGRHWIIDPIDATKNYLRGVPIWATLIALVVDGKPVVGVVSAPALGRRWYAAEGQGAWTTDAVIEAGAAPRQIEVSEVKSLRYSSFSFSDPAEWDEADSLGALNEFSMNCWRTRGYGDFYSHILVAEGAVEISAEPDLSLWDVAALIPVVREAGGEVTNFQGEDALFGPGLVATNGRLHFGVQGILAGETPE